MVQKKKAAPEALQGKDRKIKERISDWLDEPEHMGFLPRLALIVSIITLVSQLILMKTA